MSGFEIVGVVLGVLPLIISAIEDYEKIIDPVVTFRKYSKALQTFTTELNVQRDIFQNECIWILSRFVNGHDLQDMLKDPSHHLRNTIRSDEKLDGTVSKTLGLPYGQLRDILALITESLNQIYEDTKDLSGGLPRPAQTESEPVDFRAWRHQTRQKLKLSLGKSALNKKIDDLRHRNQAFLAISQQISRSSTSWAPNASQHDLQNMEKNLKQVQKLRTASRNLYLHLEKILLCPIHSEHSVNLRLCLETSELYKDVSSEMSFNMAFTYGNEEPPNNKRKPPVLLAIESTTESVALLGNKISSMVRFTDEKADENAQPSHLQRQSSAGLKRPETSGFRKIFRKSKVERGCFAEKSEVSTTPSIPGKVVPSAPTLALQKEEKLPLRDHPELPSPQDLSAVPDLCLHILESSKPGNAHTSPSIGCLSGLGEDRYTVYSRNVERPHFSEIISLTNMISNRSGAPFLSKSEKWRVAGALSLAVLLYNSTPWLQNDLKSDDVLFIHYDDPVNPQAAKIPHIHSLGGKARRMCNNEQISNNPWVKNQMLYCLGITLLEIEFGDRLENLINWTKLPECPQLDQPLTRQLQLLKRRSGEQLGTLYGRIVRMCLDCDFGLGLDEYKLQDSRVQKVFYSQVIVQFQERMPAYSKIWSDE